jgi:biotin carboxyl carrier protein
MKEYKFKIDGKAYDVCVEGMEDGKASVKVNGEAYSVELGQEAPAAAPAAGVSAPSATPEASSQASPKAATSGAARKIVSPLPGVIVEVDVKEGDSITAGQKVAVLEAMKMENEIQAEFAGTVTAVHVATGDSVLEGAPIVSIG